MRTALILSTHNAGKIREMAQLLSDVPLRLRGLDEFGAIDEAEETGGTFAANACAKAVYYAQATGQWCLAEDSGLVVDALGGAPGVYSARYAADELPGNGEHVDRAAVDRANNAKLLRELEDVEDDRRTARFVCHIALGSPDGILAQAFDTIEGRIGRVPQGEGGFGYDPLFVLPERGCTTAQLAPEDKNAVSHRGKATRAFARLLTPLLADQ